MGSTIREWLRNTHTDLEVYSAHFDELGYNPQFLVETESEELEQDLKSALKKVHLRVVLKAHAKLKTQKLPENLPAADATATAPGGARKSAKLVEPSVFQLIPCAKDVMTFQQDSRIFRSGQVVLVPIWCLRSIQGKVHSEMTFTSGKHKDAASSLQATVKFQFGQDASVYELIHDMLSGRQRPDQVEPLQVVVDERGRHIVRGHRRGLALCALQGMWRHRTVLAPCRLYGPTDPEVAGQFVLKDTAVDGLGLQLHGPPGKYPEAWHRGKPLFRTAQEWCDSLPEAPAPSTSKNPAIQQEQAQPSHQDHATSNVKSGSLQDSVRSAATQSSGLVEPDHHFSSTTHNQEEAANAIHVGEVSCEKNEYDPKVGWLDGKPELPQPEAWLATGWQDTQSDCTPEVCVSMLVYVQCEENLLCGEVLEVSNSLVKLRYLVPSKDEWISMERLLLPDYSLLQPGMEVTARFGHKTCACTVLDVSQSQERERLRAPVKVRHSGPGLDEWIGIDRLQLQHVKLLPVKAPKVYQSVDKTQEVSVSKAKEEHADSFLQAECGYGSSTATGNEPLKKGTMVCVKGSGSRMTIGEVLEMSWLNVVKVRYSARGQCHVVWFPLDRLKVPDFSNLKEGMQIHVEDEAGKPFLCQILKVSQDDKAGAPVYVHYKGYDSDYDEWVGADRIRSKSLILREPVLQTENMKGQHPGSLKKQVSQQTKLSTRLVSDGSDLGGKGAKLLPLQDVPLKWVPKTEDLSACHNETSQCVCCFWLLGKCRYARQHSIGKTLHLHKDVPGLQCGYGMHCWHKHFKRRSSRITGPAESDELPTKDLPPGHVPEIAIDPPAPQASPSPQALPWNELETETKAFESALRATEDALVQQKEVEPWQPKLETTLAAVETEGLRGVLEKHSWSGQRFAQPPQLEELLEDLNGVPGPCDEDSDVDSDSGSRPSIPSNDLESSCAAAPNDWEDRMARQSLG